MRSTKTFAVACAIAAGAAASTAAGADIYWAETSRGSAGFPTGRVGYAPLAGGGTVSTYVENAGRPTRVAVSGNTIAWNLSAANPFPVLVWNLAKTGASTTAASTTDSNDFGPQAINAAAGKIYFGLSPSNSSAPGLLQVANLDGSGSPTTVYTRAAN